MSENTAERNMFSPEIMEKSLIEDDILIKNI